MEAVLMVLAISSIIWALRSGSKQIDELEAKNKSPLEVMKNDTWM